MPANKVHLRLKDESARRKGVAACNDRISEDGYACIVPESVFIFFGHEERCPTCYREWLSGDQYWHRTG